MITKEEAELFLNRLVGVLHKDSGEDSYCCGKLVRVSKQALLLEKKYGQRFLISLDCVKKIKTLGDSYV